MKMEAKILKPYSIEDIEKVLGEVLEDGVNIPLHATYTNLIFVEYCLRHSIQFHVHTIVVKNRCNERNIRFVERLEKYLTAQRECLSFNRYDIECDAKVLDDVHKSCAIYHKFKEIVYSTDGYFVDSFAVRSEENIPNETVFTDKVQDVFIIVDRKGVMANLVKYIRYNLSPPQTVQQCIKPICPCLKNAIEMSIIDEWAVKITRDYQF